MASSDCDWPIDLTCLGSDWDGLDYGVQQRATDLAWATLRRLTGYRVGGCPVTVRPCKRSCMDGVSPAFWDMNQAGWGTFSPYINGGQWVNSCGCTTECACSVLCEVTLPPPVGRVDEVKVDGVVVAPTDYRVDGRSLVWTGDGECPWPTCQELARPDTEVGTFSITYLNTYPVDDLGAYAAGLLAAEYGRACAGGKCRLPSGVTSIVRQGISMEIATGAFPGGMTGIREVDTYVALWNPTPIRQAAHVYSPDLPAPRVT